MYTIYRTFSFYKSLDPYANGSMVYKTTEPAVRAAVFSARNVATTDTTLAVQWHRIHVVQVHTMVTSQTIPLKQGTPLMQRTMS